MFNLVDIKRLKEGLVIAAKVIGCIGAVITTICGIVNCFNGGKSPPEKQDYRYESSWSQYDGVVPQGMSQSNKGACSNDVGIIGGIINGVTNIIEKIKDNQRRKDPNYMPYIPYGPTQYECKNGDAFVLQNPILTYGQKLNHQRECMINPYYAYNNPYAIIQHQQQQYPYYGYNKNFGGNNMNNNFMGYENYPLLNNQMGNGYNVDYGNPSSYARYNFMVENNYNNITLEQQIQYAVSQIPEPQKPFILSNDINASFDRRDSNGRFILPKFFNQYDSIQVNYLKYMIQVNACIDNILMNHGNVPLNNNMYAKGNVPDVNGWMLCENPGGIPKRQLKNINTGVCYPIPNDFIIPSELSLTMVANLYGEQFKKSLPNVSSYDTSFFNVNNNYEEMVNRTPQIYKDSCVNLGPKFTDCKFGDSLKSGYFGPLPDKDSTIYRIQQEYTRGPELETSGLYDERLFAKERAEMYRNYNNTHADTLNMMSNYNTWEKNYITESPYQSLFLPSNSMIPDYRKQNPFENNGNPIWAQPGFRFDDLYYNNVNPMCRAMYENYWRTNGINPEASSNWYTSNNTPTSVWTNMRFDNNNNPYYGNSQIFGGPTDTAYQQMCQQVQQNPNNSINNLNISDNPYASLNFISPELRNINTCTSSPYEMMQGLYADKNNSKFFYSDSEMASFEAGNFNTKPNQFGHMNLGNIINNNVNNFIETNERWQNGRFIINVSTGVKYWVSDCININNLGNIDELVVSMPNYVKRAESVLGGGDFATYNSNLNNVNPFIRNTMAEPNGVSWTGTQSPLKAFVGGKIVIDPNTKEPFQLANGVSLENIPTASSGNYELIAALHSNLMRKVESNDPIVTKDMLNEAYDITSNMKNNEIGCGSSFKEVEDFFGNQIKVKNNKPEIKHESKFDENGREIIKTDKYGNVHFKDYKGEEFIDYKGGEIESTPCTAPLLSAEELLRNAMSNTEVYGNATK